MLPALEELELSLNGISSSSFSSAAPLTHTSFPHLLILDLSYNTLSDEAIVMLGLLPALKELHLTGEEERKRERDSEIVIIVQVTASLHCQPTCPDQLG